MSRRGRRSPEAQTRRKIKHQLTTIINQMAWHDSMKAETVCLTSHADLINYGYTQFKENFSITLVPDVDMGYVLTDSYGRGAFQK